MSGYERGNSKTEYVGIALKRTSSQDDSQNVARHLGYKALTNDIFVSPDTCSILIGASCGI